jgi:hypothetical protein
MGESFGDGGCLQDLQISIYHQIIHVQLSVIESIGVPFLFWVGGYGVG